MKRGVTVSFGFCLMLAGMILTLPLPWILAAVAAAIFHEACHYAVIRLCGGKLGMKRLQAWKAPIELPEFGRGKELICALAGPIGGVILFAFFPIFPRLAICGCLQSMFNLLPIYPLDGGRAVFCLCTIIFPPAYAEFIAFSIQWICIGAILGVGIYFTVICGLGLLPLLLAAVVFMKANFTCKQREMALQ